MSLLVRVALTVTSLKFSGWWSIDLVMRSVRILTLGSVLSLLSLGCASSSSLADGSVNASPDEENNSAELTEIQPDGDILTDVQTTSAPVESSADGSSDEDATLTEEVLDAAAEEGRRDDVAVRLLEAEPVEPGGSSTLAVEVFGVLGVGAGDGRVSVPSLSVVSSPGVTFTSVREGCTITDLGVDCAVDMPLVDGGGSPTETDALVFEFEYSVSSDAQLPVVFELEASSFENPASTDPDPSNNSLAVEVG